MSFSPTSRQIVLQEVFDEASIPTNEEILDYALRIGIDIENEPHLLYLARDGLMHALPPGWKPCFDKDTKQIYYFNFKTKKAQWEHPLDDVYRNLVKKAKTESTTCSEQVDDDSRTSMKDDLKSFEEASLILTSNDMYPKAKKLEPLSPVGKGVLKKVPLNPLKRTNSKDLLKGGILKSPLHIDEEKLLQKSESDDPQRKIVFDEIEVRKRPNSSDIRNRRNIGPMEFRHLSKQEIITPNALEKLNFLNEKKKLVESKLSESPSVENKGSDCVLAKDEGYGTEFSVSSLGERDIVGKKELTLTGGGSVFLKSNKMKSSPSSDLVTSSFSKEELSDGLLSPDVRKSGSDIESHPKGILREQNAQKTNEELEAVEKKIRKDEFDDERKTVRFNLEKELKITFEIPTVTSSESEENASTSLRKNISVKKPTPTLLPPEKEEARHIELDFDDLEIDIVDEKPEKVLVEEKVPIEPVKTVEPKKFKPSQALVKEFREIFENKTKTKIDILNIGSKIIEETVVPDVKNQEIVKSSRSDSSRSVSSQKEENSSNLSQEGNPSFQEESKSSQIGKLIDFSEKKDSLGLGGSKLKSDDFDEAFDSLVDFALKKRLELEIEDKDEVSSNRKILYREKDFLLEDILKENDNESVEESEEDKLFVPEDQEMEYLEKLESQINLTALKRKELEQEMENYEKMKNERVNDLERDHKTWVEDLEKSYEQKKKEAMDSLKKKYEEWLKEKGREFEEKYQEKHEEESKNRFKELRNEFLKKEDAEVEKLKLRLEEEQKKRLKNLELEFEQQEEQELDIIRKSFKESLNDKKSKLMKKHKEDLESMEGDLKVMFSVQKAQEIEKLKSVREDKAAMDLVLLEMGETYQEQKNNLVKKHMSQLEKLQQEHIVSIAELKFKFKNEEESLKKCHKERMEKIKMKLEETEGRKSTKNMTDTPRSDTTEARVIEKVRSEKRVVEDKYKTLKEKYILLKRTLERKKKMEEVATGSETEKSSSYITNGSTGKKNSKKKQEADKKSELEKQFNTRENFYRHLCTGDEENLLSPKNLPLQKSIEVKESDSLLDSYSTHGSVGKTNAKKKLEAGKKSELEKQFNSRENFYRHLCTADEENLMSPKNLPHQKSAEVKESKSLDSARKQNKNADENQMKVSSDIERSKEESSGEEKKIGGKRQLFSRFKAASTSRINFNNKNQGKESLSPVENLRRQLKKLEELEDQFPVTTHTDTYMRYPFTDNPQFGSSEIEFFKHRIHLERESVKRAKDALKAQKKSFENRQRELKQKLVEGNPGTKSVIDQIYQEEKELTDMEVSVHRTRALLGEKIILLRHLEQSLKRISQPLKKDSFAMKSKDLLGRLGIRNQNKEDDKTLSDLSSYSGSSGFSSTDFNDTHNAIMGSGKKITSPEQNRRFQANMQESSDIIQSLENLNSEIREIWEVLKKQQQSGQETITMLPPPPVIFGELGWPAFTLSPPLPFRNTVITSTSNLQRSTAQQYKTQVTGTSGLGHVSTVIDSSLIDRTRSLRDWLKSARSVPSDVIDPSQATL